jgi:hypothetical protein
VATRFLQAANKKTGFKSMLHDIDTPLALFSELAKKNTHTGEKMSDWEFSVLDYNGRTLIKNYDWKKIKVIVSLGDLFR